MFKPSAAAAPSTQLPVPVIHTKNGDLNQGTEIHYKLDVSGSRVAAGEGVCMTRRMRMKLPLLFCPHVWRRHSYSLSDVVDTLNYFASMLLWQLAVLLGLQLSNSSVKLAFSSPSAMVFSSKAIVIERITKQLDKYYKFPPSSVLEKTHEEHVPPLPIHRINGMDYQLWKSRTPTREAQHNMMKVNVIEDVFEWKSITLVPMGMEDDCIYMIRVVDMRTFEESGRECGSLCERPMHFSLNGADMYGLCDEAAFFLPGY